jgi:hypothetical protein
MSRTGLWQYAVWCADTSWSYTSRRPYAVLRTDAGPGTLLGADARCPRLLRWPHAGRCADAGTERLRPRHAASRLRSAARQCAYARRLYRRTHARRLRHAAWRLPHAARRLPNPARAGIHARPAARGCLRHAVRSDAGPLSADDRSGVGRAGFRRRGGLRPAGLARERSPSPHRPGRRYVGLVRRRPLR